MAGQAPTPQPLVLQAIEALRRGARDEAVALLRRDFAEGQPAGERWRSVAMLAQRIGETGLQLEASRRFARTQPVALARLLHYWGDLAALGRSSEALAEVERLDPRGRAHPAVLHFLGTVAGSAGEFAQAEALYRRALAVTEDLPQTWFALAMLRRFEEPGDADLRRMEALRPRFAAIEPALASRFLYGLAKAWHDVGEHERAFALYSEGAALRRRLEVPDLDAIERMAEGLIGSFTADGLARLTPSGHAGSRALFVNGLPRSGTTLVEQILTSHSQVADGGEIALVRAALIPTLDHTMAGALRYQQRGGADPWGDLARSYHRLLAERFGPDGLVVDKTLVHSHLAGLLLHMLPDAQMVWLRRDPEDMALSTFRSYFTSPVPWSWSLADIGRFYRIEDRLHRHWQSLFGERILTVPYEGLATAPGEWVPRILAQFGLAAEPQVFAFHQTRREVRTASVQQVRAPISDVAIGKARLYDRQLEPFRRAYRG